MKRTILAILISALLLGVFPASAASDPALVGSQAISAPGETVTITLNLQSNPGLAAWKIDLAWDTSVLSLCPQTVALNTEFSKGMLVENSKEEGKLCLVWANTENVHADGDLITLDFLVASDAPSGVYPITITTSGTRAQDGTIVTVRCENAAITLPGQEPEQPGTPPTQDADEPQDTDTSESPLPFLDVEKDAYYYAPTVWAVENGITNGTSPTAFSPDMPCSRAQVVTFLWRAAGSPEPNESNNPFVDVTQGAYYYKAVLWAVEQGITTGTSATTFSPDAVANRAQTVTFLWRSCGSPVSAAKSSFTDVTAGSYYETAVLWAVENNITTGTSATTFSPDTLCSRGQIVTFLYRTFGNRA